MTDSSKTGTITGIARRTAPRSPMITISASRVTRESGLEGDFRGNRESDRLLYSVPRPGRPPVPKLND